MSRWTPPKHIDELRVERLLGRGAMAGVWLARDTLLERDVALKIAEGPQTAETRLRLRMEARAVGRLQHPNIVAVHRAGEVSDRPFLVTELLGGRSLDLVHLPLPLDRVLAVGADLARGLAAAHAAGVLHRDMKPANAFLCDDGSAKLLDFGLAQLRHASSPPPPPSAQLEHELVGAFAETHAASLSSAGLAGTPLYMAPETWRGEPATRRTDVYSLGGVLYELLTGRPPYGGETMQDLRSAVLAGGAEAPAAEPGSPLAAVTGVVMRCLDARPDARPTADDVCRTLEAVATAALAEPSSGPVSASPYRGLRPFEPEHRGIFFGREAETAAVIAELRVAGLVLLVGPSGAGKSSLLRAGVVPRVATGALGPRTRAVVMVPGADPVERLAHALAPALGVDEGRVALSLFDSPTWAADRLRSRPGSDRLVLVLDQFEEVWTLSDPAQRATFLEALAALVRARPLARVVATIRSDFLARLEDLGALRGEALRAAVVLGPLSGDGLRRAIAEPARRRGVTLAPALVEHLVEAARAHAEGALPLLEFALAELWSGRAQSSRALGLDDLAALGGLEGALAAHADSAVGRLGEGQRNEAKRLLLGMVTLERTRARREGRDLDLAAPDARTALEALVEARIVVASAGDGGPSYEIAHEALVSEWPALRGWLEEESGAREVEARLARAAAEWSRLGGGRDGLLGEQRLREAERLGGRVKAPVVLAFLEASRGARRRARLRRGMLVLGLPVALALASAAAWAQGALQRRARMADTLSEARRLSGLARGQAQEADDLRVRAFAAYDRDEPGAAEPLWREVLSRRDAAADARRAALAVLDRALALDPHDPVARALHADVTFDRIVASEPLGDPALLAGLRAQLPRYDDGSRAARLSAPGHVDLAVQPGDASLALGRYRDRGDGHLEEVDVAPLGPGAHDLAPGSYVLAASAAGRAPARLPFVVSAGATRRLRIDLPAAAAVPAGMIYVPGAAFFYGSADDEPTRAFLAHQPVHEIAIPGFLVARLETTYGEYLAFLGALAGAERRAQGVHAFVVAPDAPGGPQVRVGAAVLAEGEPWCPRLGPCVDWKRLPVVSVTRADATAYAGWLASTGRLPGARLCGDREWELAARGADGRRFPWGDAEPTPAEACVSPSGDPSAASPCEVGSHDGSRSVFGVQDATGNAWEWVAGAPDRSTPRLGSQRGGGFRDDGPFLALPNRGLVSVDEFDPETGIRVCADLPPGAQ